MTIWDPAGRDRGRLSIPHDGMRRIHEVKGRIRDADGRVVRELKKGGVCVRSAGGGHDPARDDEPEHGVRTPGAG